MPSWDQSVPNPQDQAMVSARKVHSDELINNRTLRCLQIQGSPKVVLGIHQVFPQCHAQEGVRVANPNISSALLLARITLTLTGTIAFP